MDGVSECVPVMLIVFQWLINVSNLLEDSDVLHLQRSHMALIYTCLRERETDRETGNRTCSCLVHCFVDVCGVSD